MTLSDLWPTFQSHDNIQRPITRLIVSRVRSTQWFRFQWKWWYCVRYTRILPLLILCFSQSSVATCCRCGGKYDTSLVTNLLLSLTVKEFKKIGQCWSKLWTNIKWHVFMAHGVYCQFINTSNINVRDCLYWSQMIYYRPWLERVLYYKRNASMLFVVYIICCNSFYLSVLDTYLGDGAAGRRESLHAWR